MMTRRRKLITLTVAGALVFLAAVTIAAVRVTRAGPEYRPGEDVEGVTADLARALPTNHPHVTFVDVTRDSHIDFRHFYGKRASWLPEDMGSGAAWGDFDNDGWADLAVGNLVGSIDLSESERAKSPARVVVYHNNHDGTFTDVTAKLGIDFKGWANGVYWADYDNDGNVDLLITAYGHNALYHNNGDGTFTDRSLASGVGVPEGFWAGAAWGDYDRDGWLDLYVTGYVKFEKKSKTKGVNGQDDIENPSSINPLAFEPERNLLFHNNGNGTFTEVARAAGVIDTTGRGLSAAWVDLDEDGWPDLYVANDVSANSLYRNLGNGKFENIGETARVSDYRSSMGIAVGDWNGDGTQDLFLTHWLAQGNALYDNYLVRPKSGPATAQHGAASARVKINTPRLTFMDESDRYGLGQVSLDYIGWATSFIDYDNDGKLDLFVVNGSTLQRRDDPSKLVPMVPKLFWNDGVDQGFYDVSAVSGDYFKGTYVGRGAAFADYDNDGDMDVFVVNHGGEGVLLRNDGGNRKHWLQVALRGTKSNRQGIGAKIRLVAGGVVQVRQVGAQGPYLSQNSLIEQFGLDSLSTVDSLSVWWPSGARDELANVRANERVLIVEGHGAADAAVSSAPPAPLDRGTVQNFWALYREATQQRIDGQLAAAAATYDRALAINPRHEDVLYYSGGIQVQLGNFSSAARYWRQLLQVNPSSARTQSQLGALYMCLEPGAPFQLDSARVHLDRAREINQEQTGPLVHLGELSLMRGDTTVARRDFAAVMKTNAGSAPAHFYIGYLSWKAGQSDDARREFIKAVTAPAPVAATTGLIEGDTKHGSAMTAQAAHCSQLDALWRRGKPDRVDEEMANRYRALDRLLAQAYRRGAALRK